MGTVSVTLPNDGDNIDAADYNTPITSLVNEFNGNIDNNNIKSGAAISTSKLATDAGITTGMLNDKAVTSAKQDDGVLVQSVYQGSNDEVSTTTLIPLDDTIPQSGEGAEAFTVSITPKSSTNILEVEAKIVGSSGVSNNLIIAIFRDSGADAIAAGVVNNQTSGTPREVMAATRVTAGSTSATTFKVRFGGNAAGTSRINAATTGNRLLGAIPKSYIIVREYKAS